MDDFHAGGGASAGADQDVVLDRMVGARWWSLDIHAHSPTSFDYGGVDGQHNDAPKPSHKEWIQAYLDAGVDGIVIADHNSHEGIAPARQALAELRDEDPTLPPLVIFPGVELTVTGGTHLLAIFDPQSSAEVVYETLTLCNFNGTRGRSDQTADVTVSTAAKIIAERGGLCVPAHADKKAGVLGMDPRDLEALGNDPNVVAVEVIDDSQIMSAERRHWVPLLGSDAHHLSTESHPDPESAKAPGTHLTLVKAETLDLQGLRLALTDPTESIKRCRKGYSDPNDIDHGYVNSVVLHHRGAVETYGFGPWMNCLIGGRGVGKSTVVELLRLALGRTHELPRGVAADLRRFSPQADGEERWWNADTRIVVNYTKDRRRLRAIWSGSDSELSTIELWDGGKWERQSGRVLDRAPIRVFSQKQIYELASTPQSFLTVLDDMPPIHRNEWDEEYEAIQLRFRGERNKLRKLLSEAQKADRIRGELQDVRGRLRHLEELRASQEFQELDALDARLRDSKSAEVQATEIEGTLTTSVAALRGLTTDALEVESYAERSASFSKAADLLDEAVGVIRAGRATWAASDTSEQWEERVRELNEWLSKQGDPSRVSSDQTRQDRQREAQLEIELAEIESSDERCAEQEKVITQILSDLTAKRRELYERRKGFANELFEPENSLTKVEVFHQGDIASLGESLRGLLRCPDSFDTAFGQDGFASFLNKYEPKDPRFTDKVSDFKRKLSELVEQGTASEIGGEVKVDGRFYSRLANADTFDIVTDIMLWFPDDLVSVRYRIEPGGNFKAVDRGSPGQRTAALLTVILQMGTDPLLLDQPEDDLENKLIRHLAVATLKHIKRSRQLIVSTHNANMVVTSGAENVLVLRHGDKLPAIEAEGTLQQVDVKNQVCEILEGGEEAIRTRYRRLVASLG